MSDVERRSTRRNCDGYLRRRGRCSGTATTLEHQQDCATQGQSDRVAHQHPFEDSVGYASTRNSRALARMPGCARAALQSIAIPAAHSGHSPGCHRLCDRRSRSSRAMPCSFANSAIEFPRASSALMTTTSAPISRKSKNVPLTADPALMTSFTIATRFPDTAECRDLGSRYSTGKSPWRIVSSNRSAYVNWQPNSNETSRATNAPSTSGPHTAST